MSDSIEQTMAGMRSDIKDGNARTVDSGINAISEAAKYVSRANVDRLIAEKLLNKRDISRFYADVVEIMVDAAFATMRSQSHSANLIAPYPTLIVINKTMPRSVEGGSENDEGEYPYSSFLPHLMRGYKKYFKSLRDSYDSGEWKNASLDKLDSIVDELNLFAGTVCQTDPPGDKKLIKLSKNIRELKGLCLEYFAKQPGEDSIYIYEDVDEDVNETDLFF